MHSSGSMTRIRSAWWMQSTGQTSTQERSLMSMHGSAMMYVTATRVYSGGQLLDDLSRPLLEGVLHQHLVEPSLVRATEPRGVGVASVPENRYLGVGVRDVVGIDAADVGDHQIRPVRAVRRDEMVPRKERLELAPKVDIDPT